MLLCYYSFMSDQFLKKSILATLIYYDIFDYPLTAGEIFNLLINPGRFDDQNTRTALVLEELVKERILEQFNGFYFLPGRQNLYEERIERNKIAEEKWKKIKRYLWIVQVIPYIEVIFASGSLALGHTSKESDLDVLVVAKKGRIWLARLWLSVAMNLLGVRRKNKERVAPNKICLNHYVTTGSLKIPFKSLYNAQTYAHLVPIYWSDKKIIDQFWWENLPWMKKFLCRWENPNAYQRRGVRPSRFLRVVGLILEKFLEKTGLAGWLEKLARKIQISRINTNLPGRITVNDQQLEFHPYSIEKDVVRKYNLAVAKLGIFGSYQETDSGLR